MSALLGFTLPQRGARGRLVRLDDTLNDILAAHAYAEPQATVLAEALILVTLLGDLLRPDDGQLTLQARGEDGPLALLVADWRDGEVRGYAHQDFDRRYPLPDTPTLKQLFGKGYLAITLEETAHSERYQGIVELGDTSLQDAAETYFNTSEQVPTLVRLAAARDAEGHWRAGGFLAQQLPRAEVDGPRLHIERDAADWEHVQALASTLQPAELLDPNLGFDTLLWRLFHEDEVRVLPERAVTRGCRCSEAHIRSVLQQFPDNERAEMRNAEGTIAVDCEFCSKQFLIDS